MKIPKKLLVALVCIVATFCVGCSENQEVKEVNTVTPVEDFSTTTEVIEEIDEVKEIEEIEEIEPVEEIELTSIFTNEDAHTLYQEFIEYLADKIRWSVQNFMVLEISEEAENELKKIQESKFYNVSWVNDYMSNRMGNATDFNYAFLDIDNNGIDEFFLLENESLVEFFYIVDGEIERGIGSTGWKSYAEFLNDFKFYYYSNGGGAGEGDYYVYEFTDNELILTNCYAKRNYISLDYTTIFNLPAIDGEILWYSETNSISFAEHEAFNEYLLDEQGEEEFNAMIYDRYLFETVYPLEY